MSEYRSVFNAEFCLSRSVSGGRNAPVAAAISLAVFIAAALTGTQAMGAVALEPTQGLIGFWPGDNTANDLSSVGNNGSFGGSYVPGRPGGDAAFNLATAKVDIANNAVYDSFRKDSGWTVSFWFNGNGNAINSGNGTFLGQDNGSGFQPKWFIDYGYSVYTGPTNDFYLHLNDYNQERLFLASSPVSLLSDQWYQMTVVVDNSDSSLEFYLNSQLISTVGLPSYVLETSAPLIFGATEPGLSFNGLMNDVAIYGRAISPQEVVELYDSTLPVPEPTSGLLAIGAGMVVGLRRFARRNQA